MTPDELKALQEELQKAWKDFRDENDKLIKNESVTTKQNVDTLNKRIDELQTKIADGAKTAQERADQIEKKLNRTGIGPAVDEKAAAQELAIFNAVRRPGSPAVTREQYDAYCNAFGEYLRRGDRSGVLNDMSVGSEATGGYLLAPAVAGPMVKKLYETSAMRQIASVMTISTSDSVKGIVDNDEASTGWVSEIGTRSTTDTPEVGKWEIFVHEQYASPRITQTLLDDAAFGVDTWLADKVADKLGRTENTAFVSGTGSGKPRGFLDYSKVTTTDATRAWNALQYIASGAAGDWAASNPADKLIDMVYALKAGYRAGATWMAARATVGGIRKFKDGQGQYLWQPGLTPGQPQSILGFPVAEAEDMPAIAANTYSLAFGNFKAGYLIVDRQGTRVLFDPYTAKPYIVFYTTKRTGGGLINGEAIKLMKFAAS